MKELLVKTKNPKALDQTLNQMGAVIEQDSKGGYLAADSLKYGQDVYAVRAMGGDLGYIKFACQNQGYAEIVGERDN